MRHTILKLYKDLLRYGENLKHTDKSFFKYRIRKSFKENKHLTDQAEINFQLQKGQKLLQNQRVINNNNWDNILNGEKQIRYKSYKHLLDYSKVPKLQENDLQEQYVRGSGPGGQATNKTSNAVVLKHIPTGLVIKCHETRSLCQNKKIAREIMLRKLDNLINGQDSLQNQEERFRKEDYLKKKQKKKKLADLKKAFIERENITEDAA